MAEDDDDEAFGDFAFAPFQSNFQFNNASNSSAAAAGEDEDDEWGDFMEPPSQSKQSVTAANGDHHRSGDSASWMKPLGALPLSLFGDAEEEAEAETVAADLNREKRNGAAQGFGSGLVVNGVVKPKSFSIADLYDRYSQTNHEGRDLAVKDDSVVNGVYSSAKQNAAEAAAPELRNVDLSDQNQVVKKSDPVEFNFMSYMSDPSKEGDLFGGWNGEFNGFGSNSKTSPENVLTSSLDLDVNVEKQQSTGSDAVVDDAGDGDDGDGDGDDDDDDDEWDFKDADSEFQAQDVNNNVGLIVRGVSDSSLYTSGTGFRSTNSLDLFGASNGSIDFLASSTEPVDFFANPSSNSTVSREVDLIGTPSSATLNGFTSDEPSIIEENNFGGLLEYREDVGVKELDEDFGDFGASAKTGPEPKELFINNFLSPSEDAVQTPVEKLKEKDANLNHHKGAIPLSIFGDEDSESGSPSDVQDIFAHQSIPAKPIDRSASSVSSINDMLSHLYSQAEQTSSTNTEHNLIESQLNPSSVVSSSNLVDDVGDDNDDDDDGSWDFKDASEMRFDSEASLTSTGDAYTSKSSKLKLDNYLDFYLKLKEELYYIGKNHIDRLKNAQADADLSVEGFDSEVQLFCNELAEEGPLHDHDIRDGHLHEFAEVLLEPKFQRLESEYHLSQKLLKVEKDLGSSMELIRHTNAMLKILNLGTLEEQKVYVSLWSEMISVCAQELRHGASIWNSAVMQHVQSQFLSESQGRKFVLALGEIYRVVVVLGASAIFFKPWILSSSVDSTSIYLLLEECRALWSTSGLEEALASVSAPTTLNDTSLFKSVKHILGLDELKLGNYVFAEKESRCCLSLLTAGVVPDLKIVMWGNEQCFVTLANLRANLISHYPPKLPQLNLG